jgi:signal transduction histidine kinase
VQGLRSSTVIDSDLIQRLTILAEELSAPKENQASPTFRLLVKGRPRLLDPILQDEIYRIAREALADAFRYAHAQNIEAENHVPVIAYLFCAFEIMDVVST